MKELKSPYVLDVYRYDDANNEYYMEYADETLYDFIKKNNNKLSRKRRRGIAYQIFKGFSYIHSKNIYTEILVLPIFCYNTMIMN